jgi:3-isopropylmalate/(R)-2-methylmalate dehydratase small subunit
MMEPFRTLTGIAVPLDEPNIDTNQLCPSRFNKLPLGPGFERVLFHDRRYAADESERPDFILNREPYRQAKILVADRNFGCGSSRENAVLALLAFGIRAVVGPSFGDIFFNNALKNGLLPVAVGPEVGASLRALLHERVGLEMSVDLESCIVRAGNDVSVSFEIDDLMREKLLHGLDDIALTERLGGDLAVFERDYYKDRRWLPVRAG